MRLGDILKTIKVNKKSMIELDKIYPIKPLPEEFEVDYLIDDEKQTLFDNVYYANKLMISADKETSIDILLGEGYLAEPANEMTNKFITDDKWQGGDGIFSFNLEDGNDSFDQVKIPNHLLVFGDTFVGQFDKKTLRRYQPHLMPNNSFAFFDEAGNVEFKLNRGRYGEIKAFYEIEEEFDRNGSIPRNLVNYDPKAENIGYLSSYNPDSIELIFDLFKPRQVETLEIFNYFSKESDELAKRGMKEINILGSDDLENWNKIKSVKLEMAKSITSSQNIMINNTYRYFKITSKAINGICNYNDGKYKEGLFGLNLVKFYSKGRQLKDIHASSNSIMSIGHEHSWIWLQDGVVIDDNLYFLPLIVAGDQTAPEGLQFKIKGIQLFKTPIKNGKPMPEMTLQKLTPVFTHDNRGEYYFGAGIMANTVKAGAKNPDGYVYIYGYVALMGARDMLVARVKEADFEYFDDWEYYDGEKFVKDLFKAKPVLKHISCELSVSPLLEGKYKGKYIAVFTHDTNTEYVSFAIGDTPVGPFTKPQKVYKTLEHDIFGSTTYTYNAKAHPSLSQSKNILVSYNTNTYNFEHNMSNRLIYKPRFIYLTEI